MYWVNARRLENLNKEENQEGEADEKQSVVNGTMRFLVVIDWYFKVNTKSRVIYFVTRPRPTLRIIAVEVQDVLVSFEAILICCIVTGKQIGRAHV